MTLKMYEELAEWWPLLSPVEESEDEIAFFLEALDVDENAAPRTMLELGSGGGSNAYHLKKHFTITLVDLAPKMLDVSRTFNPECEHFVGDMRTVRLGQQFDVVLIHDAIDYMTTEDDLRQAIETAFVHCKTGGVVLIVPDHVRDTFEEYSEEGGSDGVGRALRYLEWTFDPDPTDTLYTTHYVFMLREGSSVHVEHEEHIGGLFPRADWLRLLGEVGFQTEPLVDEYGRDVFVATKPDQ